MRKPRKEALHWSVRCKMVKGPPAHLMNFVIVFFLVPELRSGDIDAQLDDLNVMGLIVVRNTGGQKVPLNNQR